MTMKMTRGLTFWQFTHNTSQLSKSWGGGGYSLTPYNGLYGEALTERGTFFRLQVYKRVGFSQVEVRKRVGKSSHLGI